MTKEQILEDFLNTKLKLLGRVRAFYPTEEAKRKIVEEFNKKYETNFELE